MQITSIAGITPAMAILLATLVLQPDVARAQNAPAVDQRSPSSVFFKATYVDFFGDRARAVKKRASSEKTTPKESIWAEPIRGADGKMSVHVPPAAVLQFIENPTMETGRQYLNWQKEKMEKIAAGVEILRKLKEQDERGKASASASASVPPPAQAPVKQPLPPLTRPPASAAGELLYFKRPNCPYCQKQDKVLTALKQTNPDVRMRTLNPGEAPELWEGYGVKIVPTIIVRAPGGKQWILRGFMTQEQVIQAFQSSSLSATKEVIREEQ